jgi:hypothetical protein
LAKFNLLLLDTCVILELFRLGIWGDFLKQCDVHVSTVIMDDARFYEDDDGEKHMIDWTQYTGRLTVHDVDVSDLRLLTDPFGPGILEKLDSGEAELLAVLCKSFDNYKICSSDAIVFRVLGALKRSGQGVSLEEIIGQIGMTKALAWQHTKNFREHWSKKGFEQGITGLALKR